MNWISVKERLPNSGDQVMVTNSDWTKKAVADFSVCKGGGALFYFPWNENSRRFTVTHWMPLPPPPKQPA